MLSIRPYQLEAIEAVKEVKLSGINRQLISLPTGTGKTVTFAALAKDFNVKTIVIAHREELIQQAVDKFRLVWPEVDIGIVMADYNDIDKQIVIASVQTISRPKRLEKLKECGFELMIIDEAHHAASESYQTIINGLGFTKDNLNKLLVGVTATPTRGDGHSLGDTFESIVFERSISTMIKAGYLSDLKGKRILTHTDLSSVSIKGGDYIDFQLSEVINTPQRNDLVVRGYIDHGSQRRALAFCVDVAHSVALSKAFTASGIRSASVYGDMDKDDRRSILRQFEAGELQVVTNCNLLTEGYDHPEVACILMARPTQSLTLYTQCIGRGTRIHPRKKDCLVIDYTDNSHDIGSVVSLQQAVPVPAIERSDKEAIKDLVSKENIPRSVHIEHEEIGDFDLFERSNFAWVPVQEHWVLTLSHDISIWLHHGEAGYTASIKSPDGKKDLSKYALPLGYAQGIAEDWARKQRVSLWAQKDAVWRQRQPSEKQLETLAKLKIQTTDGMTKGDASFLIGQKMEQRKLWANQLPTQKQIWYLHQNGIKINSSITRGEAARIIATTKGQKTYA